MSEQLASHEHHEHLPSTESEGRQKEKLLELLDKAERTPDEHKEHLPELQQDAKEKAVSGKEYAVGEHTRQPMDTPAANQELKRLSLDRMVTRIQQRYLSLPEKVLSKTIHQPVVDQISTVGEKTIARPSGLLGGSICAFVGSSAFLWAAKHYGFAYNYLLFFLFFVGGFVLGMFLELCMYILRHKRRLERQ